MLVNLAARITERWRGANGYLVDSLIAALVLVALSVQFVVPRESDAPEATWASYGLTVLMAVSLIWRRRFPFLVLLASSGAMVANQLVIDGVGQPLPYAGLLAAYTVAAESPRRQRIAMNVIAIVAIPIVVAFNSGELREFLFTFFTYFSAYALGRLARSRREQNLMLLARAEQLERANLAEARQAAAAERARIARDMHDILSHSVSLIIVQAEAGPVTAPDVPDRAVAAFDSIADTGRQAMTQLRRMLGVLTDDAGAGTIGPQPGLADLAELAERVGRSGPRVRLTVDGVPGELPFDVQLAVYRIVQEALTNVVKHAAAADVSVRLDWTGEALAVTVSDDGGGVRGTGGGHGLINMRERAAAHGGTVHAGPVPSGTGFQVTAVFPLEGTKEVPV